LGLKPNKKITKVRTLEGDSKFEKLVYGPKPLRDHGLDQSSIVTDSRVYQFMKKN